MQTRAFDKLLFREYSLPVDAGFDESIPMVYFSQRERLVIWFVLGSLVVGSGVWWFRRQAEAQKVAKAAEQAMVQPSPETPDEPTASTSD